MLRFLHITNGDSAANIIKETPIEGDTLPWRDTMHYGPFPSELNLDEVSLIRAKYFSEDSIVERQAVEKDFALRNNRLKTCQGYDEVVLWFEHDLLDQLQILQILDWFADNQLLHKLSIICINAFSGIEIFRGIGQLNVAQMASLFEQRSPVSQAQITLAQTGWAAFRSPKPNDLVHFINNENLQALPFLKKALSRHLLEYPHLTDGLTQTERQILTLVSQGTTNPAKVFSDNMIFEDALFIGDWATYRIMSELSQGEKPLLVCASGEDFIYPPEINIPKDKFIKQRLYLTTRGEQVLSGQTNANDIVHRDYWLGGVHIESDQSLWMWDADHQHMVLMNSNRG